MHAFYHDLFSMDSFPDFKLLTHEYDKSDSIYRVFLPSPEMHGKSRFYCSSLTLLPSDSVDDFSERLCRRFQVLFAKFPIIHLVLIFAAAPSCSEMVAISSCDFSFPSKFFLQALL